MAKREFTVKKSFRSSGKSLKLDIPIVKFDGGIAGSREYDMSKLGVEILTQAVASGAFHTLGDMMAMKQGSTPKEKFAAMDARFGAWMEGLWSREREKVSAEERYARFRLRVQRAWEDYKGIKDGTGLQFNGFVTGRLAAQTDKTVTEEIYLKALAKHPEIEKRMEKEEPIAVEIGEL
jgi:hypothetical protein